MEWYELIGLSLTGFLAGIINTLAGSGSVLTLSALMLVGLPPTLANATNRLGVTIQTLTSLLTLRKNSDFGTEFKTNWPLVIPAFIGAWLGAQLATLVSDQTLTFWILAIMTLILTTFFTSPKSWKRTEDRGIKTSWKTYVLLLVAGSYAGFIQMGVGIILLSTFILGAGWTLKRANLFKQFVVFGLAIIPLVVFIAKGMIQWDVGLTIGIGQGVGGWYASKYLLIKPQFQDYIRKLVFILVCLAITGVTYQAFFN